MNTLKRIDEKSMYCPTHERDSCGVGCVVNLKGEKSHNTVESALRMLENMEHRGATGADPNTGDGAGILIQIPDDLYRKEIHDLPKPGTYGVGMFFFPQHEVIRDKCKEVINSCTDRMSFDLIGFREVPTDRTAIGHASKSVEPFVEQFFVKHTDSTISSDELERKLFVLSSLITKQIRSLVDGENSSFYVVSCSARTVVYKGQLKTSQLREYYLDLQNEVFTSALAIVHSRFSTNTFPNWKLAQPFHYVAHNGEINTIRGNVTKMKSKEALMSSPLFTDEELSYLIPVTDPKNSDSANLDSLVELLTLSGRSLAHVLMMLVPEAWEDNPSMNADRKSFYKYHSGLMEPWDGPAALFFTNGNQIGATLDRNGLRPVRYYITSDDQLIMASEAGALHVDEELIIKKGRLQPGKMLLADLQEQKIYKDDEIKEKVYSAQPYQDWVRAHRLKLRKIPTAELKSKVVDTTRLRTRQISNGITEEDVKMIILPLADGGKEPLGSMGADIPLAVLSDQSQHISNYFKQYFAQVSNPPIDPIRERLVMSLFTKIGESKNILAETPEHARLVHVSQPVLTRQNFYEIKALENEGFPHQLINATFDVSAGEKLEQAIDRICLEAEESVRSGISILIISNRKETESVAPIPGMMAVGAIHHSLVEKRLRTKTGLIVESSDAWETHHFATMIGYGASGIYPYLTYDTIMHAHSMGQLDQSKSVNHYLDSYVKGVGKGLLKILSKMGISTMQSYQSAQIFECIGLGQEVIHKCFKGTISRLDGLNMEDLERESITRHQSAYKDETRRLLETGGIYQWRHRGEKHLLSPEVIHLLQKSTQLNDYELFKKYSSTLQKTENAIINLRDLLTFKNRQAVPLEEVEPVEHILKRFATGAMSFGSISHEAHSTLAIAMNRIGAKSNSGEGGEDPARFVKKPNGDWERSAIKQVASGRFGVTIEYLNQADEIQIKVAQGAKPGEGGQLPGHKVDDWIARVRNSTAGVGLISPPPHHDIYSIEDLKQLIFDLKNANPKARINVKLVSQAGVGPIAVGVAKAKADCILISGADGGTGASPLSSIRHAGLPWEMGLAETHQTLVKNNLRNRVTLQTDGKIMTGKDLVVATLLGAEEYGISTAALIVEGCIMMRKCHLNTCPVGIATQNSELRKLFTGDPDHVVNFFTFLVREFREIMAQLGFRSVNEMIGQSYVLKQKPELAKGHWKISKLDLMPLLHYSHSSDYIGTHKQIDHDDELKDVLDRKIISDLDAAADPLELQYSIKNTDRAVGTLLSHHRTVNKKDVEAPIKVSFSGSAGQSFAAFLANNIQFELRGEANDYMGKGLSGGTVIIRPSDKSTLNPREQTIIGNVSLYGATSGEVYINGQGGERFAVRNSGATAVVEGIGDHGCEYMTGGTTIVLGTVGNNFGAGMSGGTAYIWDKEKDFDRKYNPEMIGIEEPDSSEFELLKSKLSSHREFTGSPLANSILENWEEEKKVFIKIMPFELKKALELKQKSIA